MNSDRFAFGRTSSGAGGRKILAWGGGYSAKGIHGLQFPRVRGISGNPCVCCILLSLMYVPVAAILPAGWVVLDFLVVRVAVVLFYLWTTFQIGVGRAGGIVLTSRELLGRGQEVRSHGGHRTEGYFLTLAGKAKANA